MEQALKYISDNKSKKILDIGTGSGCIIISILKERAKCSATAIDISNKALKVAKINAKMHHLENKIKFINIDVDKFNTNKYDLILSNPPYINDIDLSRLDNDVKIIAGCADHVVSAFSAGVKKSGDVLLKYGGAGDILFSSKKTLNDQEFLQKYY